MANSQAGTAGGKRTILVVEDNEMNREMLCAILEDDFDLYAAENGEVGLELLAEHYQDLSLVLLDAYMPVCDGFEFLRRKRENADFDTVPVVVATASDTVEDEIRCLALGANDFVVKPYNVDIMMNRINNIIRLRESASIINQVMWDSATGLYSKEFFYRELDELLQEKPDADFDMVCSDIERFEVLHERYGETLSNELLRELAEGVQAVLPGFKLGGRIAEDVFAFVVEHGDMGWTDALADVAGSLSTAQVNVKYGVKVGIDHELATYSTCDMALQAIETIKGQYGVHVALFDDAMREHSLMEQQLLDNMEQALANREFKVFYQPKHDIKADKTGGAEALVRWISPTLGFVNPGAFIPLFERNGFILQLDLLVWEEACKELRRCIDLGLPTVPISINASRLDFDAPDFFDMAVATVDRYGLDHSMLHVELTESASTDNPEIIVNTLTKFREQGFRVELDDFGSGFSSLSSLTSVPLDIIKLDMSLIRQASKSNDFRIVKAIMELAKLLGLRTVTEGVESVEEVQRLRELGGDYIQGYYYSRPLPAEDFEKYLSGDQS